MTAARSAPSGPVISPEGAVTTQGRLASASVAAGGQTTCAAVNVPPTGGSFLLGAVAQAAAAAGTTNAGYRVTFQPNTGPLQLLATAPIQGIGTTPETLPLLPMIQKVSQGGTLTLEVYNFGANGLNLTGVNAQIQPISITT
jgi:hypothetical protein